ncbi:ferredoxin [Desulfovibrio inopinatus]|uniref:ferredoxin n=1 Tax=Desulfovibrio inopinatus TaxID=102109 RepID=UPI0003F8BC21|nr:ferredoxin [Desulfovibrio inopinatus]
MAKKAYVDEDECIGCESCVEICPEAFELTDEMKAHVISEDCAEECIQEAIDTCPTECIHWAD